jgi:hypothetical protein
VRAPSRESRPESLELLAAESCAAQKKGIHMYEESDDEHHL